MNESSNEERPDKKKQLQSGGAGGRSEKIDEQQRRLMGTLAAIRHRWLVVSGKGGVGKSTVAVNLACALADRGLRVGLLDTDIHGPDVLKMLGLEGRTLGGTSNGEQAEPIKAYRRLKVVSMAAVLPDPDMAVIWRGPRKMGAIRQFLSDVHWGELDHLVVDSPPGTGDEPLSSAQLIGRADGAIIVTSPQEVALLDSRKCINFAHELRIPVTGIIENMSGMRCPHCGEAIELFGTGGGARAAAELGVPFLGAIPIDPTVVTSGDQGRPFVHFARGERTAAVFEEIVDAILESARPGPAPKETPRDGRLIAIACEDEGGLEARVSAHFGRCPCYTVVEVKGDAVVGHRVEHNPHFGDHQPGVMPQFIASLGADVILAGGMGPKAVAMFEQRGIEVATGASGTARQALEGFLQGSFSGVVPCSHDHPESCQKPGGGRQPHGAGHGEGRADEKRPAPDVGRVAIPAADDTGLSAAMDPRFGRAPYYVLVEPGGGEVVKVVPNAARNEAHGAGTSAARLIGESGVNTVVAGRFGPKALQVLQGLGIALWTAPDGLTVAEAVEKLAAGQLSRVGG
jgi:Mrp family chromosome partitioning ATPase/predicted Fe-Mo cluster-binding NifX family protein